MIKKFDKEYSTQYTPEMKYLQSKGINYSFVKDIQGVTTYKYTKTPELFSALVSFYMDNKYKSFYEFSIGGIRSQLIFHNCYLLIFL